MSSGYNCSTILSRVVGTPEQGKTESGALYLLARIPLLTYRRTACRQGEEVNTLLPVQIPGKTAEFFAKYVKKGHLVHLAGRLDGREWIANGKKGLSLSFIAETICFLPNSRSEEEQR
jgi:single-stranded DNA-binding protein